MEVQLVKNQNETKSAKNSSKISKNSLTYKDNLLKYLTYAKKQLKLARKSKNSKAFKNLQLLIDEYESTLLFLDSGVASFDDLKIDQIKSPYHITITPQNRTIANETQINQILSHFKKNALALKQDKKFTEAKEALSIAIQMKKHISSLQNGDIVYSDQLPDINQTDITSLKNDLLNDNLNNEMDNSNPNLNNETENLKISKIKEANNINKDENNSDVKVTNKITILSKKIEKQISLMGRNRTEMESKGKNRLAEIFGGLFAESQNTLKKLRECQKSGESLPEVKVRNLNLLKEVVNKEVEENCLQLKINLCDLKEVPFITFKSYTNIYYEFSCGKSILQKGSTGPKKIDRNEPSDFEETVTLQFPKTITRRNKMRFCKINFVLVMKSVFIKTPLGKAETNLIPLDNEFEFSKKMRIKDEKGKLKAELDIKVAARRPFAKSKKEKVNFKYISLAQTATDCTRETDEIAVEQKKAEKPKEPIVSSAPKEPKGTLKFPSTLPKELQSKPLALSYYVSNDVLEDVKERLNKRIRETLSKSKIPPKSVCDDAKEATVLLAALEASVESGEIDMETYMVSLRKILMVIKLLIPYLESNGRMEEVKEIRRREGIIKKEVTN